MRGPVNPFSKKSKEEPQKPRKPDLNVLIYIYIHTGNFLSFSIPLPPPLLPRVLVQSKQSGLVAMQIHNSSCDYKAIKEQPMQMNGGALYASPVIPPFFNFFFFSPSSSHLLSHLSAFSRSYYLATTEEESAVQHLYRISTRGTSKSKCLTCGIVRETDRNRCLYNTAKFSTDHSNYVLTCAGPGVPDISIYNRVSAAIVAIPSLDSF